MEFEVIVRGVIRRGNRLLIGRKRRDVPHPLQGEWHFVGGRLEYDENPWKAIKREVEEETGISVEPIGIIDAFPEFLVWPEESGIPPQYTLHLIFDCVAVEGEAEARDDIEEVRWIELDEVGNYLTKDTLLNSEKLKRFLKMK
jgi:8-oxo-dGTP pyrophosphatase MutT (NUDIX family)